MELILNVGQMLNVTRDLKKLYRLIADETLALVNYYSLAIMLLDEKTQELKLEFIAGYRTEPIRNIKFKKGVGVAGWVAEKGEPLYLPDVRKDKRYIAPYGKVRSVYCVPLFSEKKFIGVFIVDSTEVDAFKPVDLRLLRILANQVATAIDNARMFEKYRSLLKGNAKKK